MLTPSNQPNFLPNLLDWPINRRDRTFRVYVVEPKLYEPKNHQDIFDAAINLFIEPRPTRVDPYVQDVSVGRPLRFDLVTFPEAFLPLGRLVDILVYISRLKSFGCVHVGLRPPGEDPDHLFLVSEIKSLIAALRELDEIVQTDLDAFDNWISDQASESRFNIGCLFTVDANQRVRVCLHPKLVQSKFEVSPLEEHNMEEADLLTVVTLRPTNKELKTVIIQPLLCSDALHLARKRGGSRPLEAMQRDADCLGENPPDHIDIVSVATCTPQVPGPTSKAPNYRTWHNEFKSTFLRAASDDSLGRHHFATFVLSNFQKMPTGEPGGLSGAFMPVPVGNKPFPDYVTLTCYGRSEDSTENRWSRPDEDCVTVGKWQSRGFIAALNPLVGSPEAIARMFGFTVHRLPRDQALWSTNQGLTQCALKIAEFQGDPPSLQFSS